MFVWSPGGSPSLTWFSIISKIACCNILLGFIQSDLSRLRIYHFRFFCRKRIFRRGPVCIIRYYCCLTNHLRETSRTEQLFFSFVHQRCKDAMHPLSTTNNFYLAFRYILNSVPLSTWLSITILPPALFTSSFTKYNPTPEPSMLRLIL